MKRRQESGRGDRSKRLLGAVWDDLTAEEQHEALLVVRDEGSKSARCYFGAQCSGTLSLIELRKSPWARGHGGLDALPDDIFHLYMTARTIPVVDGYVEHVIERFCPERAAWWWSVELKKLRCDPRVCAFCDAFERERCIILGIPTPPTGIADLQMRLWQAKEQERERARDWMETLEEEFATEREAETQRAAARFEYLRCQWATDLAQMLLDAAVYSGPQADDRRAAA